MFLTAAVMAMSAYCQLRLDVKDPSGAAMEAAGTLTNLAGGVERWFKTNATGIYLFSDLPAGRYRLVVSRSGFATHAELVEIRAGGREPAAQ